MLKLEHATQNQLEMGGDAQDIMSCGARLEILNVRFIFSARLLTYGLAEPNTWINYIR